MSEIQSELDNPRVPYRLRIWGGLAVGAVGTIIELGTEEGPLMVAGFIAQTVGFLTAIDAGIRLGPEPLFRQKLEQGDVQ